ncbi:MAG TPA: M13 family peptidase [Cytophagales bacterium]|jgi:putative endopeptidase|nr:M13 family peptidase [Cytophagales bacterium]
MKRNFLWMAGLALGVLITACSTKQENDEAVQAIAFENMDSTYSPADDFFMFVNGKWVEKTAIPDDQGRWGSFNELRETNNEVVLNVLEKAAESGKYEEGSDQQKAADFYAIGMDSLLAEKVGIEPLMPHFEKIRSIESKESLQSYLQEQQQSGGGAFFSFSVFADLMNSSMNTAYLGQGGLGLPDKDYYFPEEERMVEIREKYVDHIARMMQFIGYTAEEAAQAAEKIMALETDLAAGSMNRREQRNIPALYNKFAVTDLPELSSSIDWPAYFESFEITNIDTIIVMQPKYFEAFEGVLASYSIDEWQKYLEWRLIDETANYLNHDIVAANFDFFGKELNGLEQMRSRWKRVLGTTNGFLGEAIGKLYVDEVFPPEAKEKAKEMVDFIILAYEDRINNLEWMSDSTKKMALKKLDAFTVKIGYPDKWKEYSGMEVSADPATASYIDNVIDASHYTYMKQVRKYGEEVDKQEWGMSPQTVNAYYNPLNNEIVFPAAILQPPFYNYKADAAVNFGGIGAVIGHEISHGFDDQGSRFDAEGNMVNWWKPEDKQQFDERSALLVKQFASYEPLEGVYVDGQLTLGENIGDLGGVNAALSGLQKYYGKYGRPEDIDGLTPEQRFFISWATIWRIKYRDEALRTQIKTDPHSPGMYRANGPLRNIPEFYAAFNVTENNEMYQPDSLRVVIW